MQLLSLLSLVIQHQKNLSKHICFSATHLIPKNVALASKLGTDILYVKKDTKHVVLNFPPMSEIGWPAAEHRMNNLVAVPGRWWLFLMDQFYVKDVIQYEKKNKHEKTPPPIIIHYLSNIGRKSPGDNPEWGLEFKDQKTAIFFTDMVVTDDHRVLLGTKEGRVFEAMFADDGTQTLEFVIPNAKLLYAVGAGLVLAEQNKRHILLVIDKAYRGHAILSNTAAEWRYAFVSPTSGYGVKKNGSVWTFCHGWIPGNLEAHQEQQHRLSNSKSNSITWFRQLPTRSGVFCTVCDREFDFWNIQETGAPPAFTVRHLQTLRSDGPILRPSFASDDQLCFESQDAFWEFNLSRVKRA